MAAFTADPFLKYVIVVDEDALPGGDERFVGYEEVWETGGALRERRAAEFERLT